MRCNECSFSYYDYSDNYEACWLGIEAYENSKGSCGCRYSMKTLKKWGDEAHKAEDEYYKAMSEAIEEFGEDLENVEKRVTKETTEVV